MEATYALRALLAEIGRQGAVLANLDVLGQALDDAVAYRDPAGSWCPDCDMHPGELCPDHVADQVMTECYLTLAGSLGIGVDR